MAEFDAITETLKQQRIDLEELKLRRRSEETLRRFQTTVNGSGAAESMYRAAPAARREVS